MKTLIIDKVNFAIEHSSISDANVHFSVDYADEQFGDYSTNAALVIAKKIGKSPIDVAQILVKKLIDPGIFKSVEVAGPGFINFKLSSGYLQKKIREIVDRSETFGNSDFGKDIKINIEFISANPTGPLTLGNGRGGYTGDVLANVLTAVGAQVEREYYINDRGAQILALGNSVLKNEEIVYKGDYVEALASRIKSKEPYAAGQEAAAILVEDYIKKTISKMGIKFDRWYSESNLFNGPVEEVMGMLDKKNLTYRQEGALWLKTSSLGDDKDRVLITSKGEFTYLAADLAYHYIKMKRGYNTLVDIWGADHHGYIARMKAGVQILEGEMGEGVDFKILIAQLVRLMSEGKEIKMSKRAGTYVTLDELIDEVGADVTRFFFLERSLDTHMDFDLDLAKEQSQKNPVYYVQYAYARINSILNKSEVAGQSDLGLIKELAELSLVKELLKFPDVIADTAFDYQIQRLPQYAVRLADKFHNFYEHCKVISEDANLTLARVELMKATKIVFKRTLDLMGISAPGKM